MRLATNARVRWTLLAVLALAAVTTAVGACTSSGGASGSAGAAGGSTGGLAVDRGLAPAGQAQRSAIAAARGGAGAPGAAGAASESQTGIGDGTLVSGTAEIKIADMTVAVAPRSVTQQADAAESIALRLGGEVYSDDRTSGPFASATLVLRVPPESLRTFLSELSRLGRERSRHASTQDVTAKVADVRSRVLSAEGAIRRLRNLYDRAVKVSDIIAVESELAQRESDLESLQAEQRALRSETSMATVTLQLVAQRHKPTPVPVKKSGTGGFLGGLADGWRAFSHGAAVLAMVVGAVLPFALLAALLAVIARLLWPRLRRHRPDRSSAAA